MNLILEDNADRVAYLFTAYPSLMTQGTFVTYSVNTAKAFMRMQSVEEYLFFLDNELLPGHETGIDFLNHVIDEYKHWIKLVTAITGSPMAREQMAFLCRTASIPFEVLGK